MIFQEKSKEPQLSENIRKIIERSLLEKNKNNFDDIIRCKSKIMNLLTSNQDILNTLHYQPLDSEGDINGDCYRNVCIFDFLKLPDKEALVKNYICFEIDEVCYGDKAEKRIIFRTVTHKDDCVTDWGVSRHDLLALIIRSQFDWSNILGMHLEKKSDNGGIADNNFYFREIVYNIVTSNNVVNKKFYAKTKI